MLDMVSYACGIVSSLNGERCVPRMLSLLDHASKDLKELDAVALPILQKMAGSGGVPGGNMGGGMPTEEEPPAGTTVEEID